MEAANVSLGKRSGCRHVSGYTQFSLYNSQCATESSISAQGSLSPGRFSLDGGRGLWSGWLERQDGLTAEDVLHLQMCCPFCDCQTERATCIPALRARWRVSVRRRDRDCY